MKIKKFSIFIFIFLFGGCFTCIDAQEIDINKEFKLLKEEMDTALINQADVLSPQSFQEAKSNFEEAKNNLEKQKTINKSIEHQISVAREYLRSANKTTNLIHQQIGDVLKARKLAIVAGATFYYPTDFGKADNLLQKISTDLTNNNIEEMMKNRAKLQASYSDLELRAIKHQNLAVARITLINAIEVGARKYAPDKFEKTLQKYKDALGFIGEHRHDESQIQKRVFAVNESARDLLSTTQNIAASRPVGVDIFEDQIRVKQSAVVKQQKSIDEKILEVRRKFTRDEADIEKHGDTLVIRLKGLKFPPARSTLNALNLRLLGILQRVVRDFGRHGVEVEGHTDSVGSMAFNSKLSKERAQTVKDYLLSIDAISVKKIKVIGRGEEVPLATNKTVEGRSQNRRADILIKL